MSPTVPTTTDSRDQNNHNDPSWIFGQTGRRPSLPNALHRRVALTNFVSTPSADQSTRRQQQQQQQQDCVDERQDRLLGWISRDFQEGITDACDGLVTVIGNKEDDVVEKNGDCWLMSHQSLSCAAAALKGTTTMTGGVCSQDDEQTIKTAEFWIHQLRSVLQETRSNLNHIVAFHQRQMQHDHTKQPTSATVGEDPSRAIIRSSKSVAVQTDLNNQALAAQTGAENADAESVALDDKSKLNYYRKSVGTVSAAASCSRQNHYNSHVDSGGSLIGQLSSSTLYPFQNNSAASKTPKGSNGSDKVLCCTLNSLADDDGCHFVQQTASNSCCALSTHSGCCLSHARSCCCRAANRQIISKSSVSQEPAYSSRINRTNSRKRVITSRSGSRSKREEREAADLRLQWANHCDTTAILLLNEAWQLAGLHSRQRMSILSRHYRILYKRYRKLRRRHRRLRRDFQRTRRRHLYVQLQLQILLESIGSQVDDVASDWVGRLKGLLRLGAFTDRDPTTADGLMGAPSGSSFSSADDSQNSSFDFAKDSSGPQKQQKQQQFRVNDDNHYLAFSLYRWYSSLSLKLRWLQTSHKTVIDNLLLFSLERDR